MWAETLAPSAVAIVVPWLAFQYALRQDRQRWSRERPRRSISISWSRRPRSATGSPASSPWRRASTPRICRRFEDHRLSDAARPLLWRLRVAQRRIRLVWADAGYAGRLVVWAAVLGLRVEIVRRRMAHAFQVLPRRWVVEHTFAWISRHRRTVRDYERLPDHHRAMVTWAMTTVMTRRLARRHRPARTPTPALPRAA